MIEKKRDLDDRLLEYGARIIRLVESLPNTVVGRRVADQLLRSGTSVGANYEEAQGAESKDDFVHKLQIALKDRRIYQGIHKHFSSAGFLVSIQYFDPDPSRDRPVEPAICVT